MRIFFSLSALLLLHFAGGCGNDAASPSPTPTPLSIAFFTFGDWGTGDSNQIAVSARAQAVCESLGCDFGLFLGDNFYDTGVSGVTDPQWKTKYQDIYGIHPALQIPLYAALGNHDWDGSANPQAQVDFDLMDRDEFWRMPAFNYSFASPAATPLLEIFVINSNQFDSVAEVWLEGALADSTAPWKIIAMHHPIFDNGSAHPDDEKGIYPALRPIICNRVQLLLSGHEHIFSHLRDSSDSCGYDQIIVGTGGRALHGTQADSRVFYTESSFGLGYFEVTEEELRLRFFRANGEEAYTFTWSKN